MPTAIAVMVRIIFTELFIVISCSLDCVVAVGQVDNGHDTSRSELNSI
jgi:hypothetical protein